MGARVRFLFGWPGYCQGQGEGDRGGGSAGDKRSQQWEQWGRERGKAELRCGAQGKSRCMGGVEV